MAQFVTEIDQEIEMKFRDKLKKKILIMES